MESYFRLPKRVHTLYDLAVNCKLQSLPELCGKFCKIADLLTGRITLWSQLECWCITPIENHS